MSGAGIELEYEERLKAAARYLEVHVDYHDGRTKKVRTFMDTPDGRQMAAKTADKWLELPTVQRVEVRPVGAGGRTGPEAARAAEGPPPAPSRRPCLAGARVCVPENYVGPSGKRLRHNWNCPDKPGEPISAREYTEAGRFDPEPWKPR